MNLEDIHEYCLVKPGVTVGFQFNNTALVFKVKGENVCPVGPLRRGQGHQPEM